MKKLTFTKEMFDDTANLWRNFNTAGIGVEYQSKNGRVQKWAPSGGVVLQHSHALLRNPITNKFLK